MDENEEQAEQGTESEMDRQRRIRIEAEKLGESMFSKETRDHLVRASTEMILAIDSMIPRDKIPEDVKKHFMAAQRETLLLFRSVLDAQINLCRDLESKEQPPETGLRKIELE
jgi:hypothetical protein